MYLSAQYYFTSHCDIADLVMKLNDLAVAFEMSLDGSTSKIFKLKIQLI